MTAAIWDREDEHMPEICPGCVKGHHDRHMEFFDTTIEGTLYGPFACQCVVCSTDPDEEIPDARYAFLDRAADQIMEKGLHDLSHRTTEVMTTLVALLLDELYKAALYQAEGQVVPGRIGHNHLCANLPGYREAYALAVLLHNDLTTP